MPAPARGLQVERLVRAGCSTGNIRAEEASEVKPDASEASDGVELAVLRERVKSLEELADYHRDLLKDSEWRYQQAMEQLGAGQTTMETLTKALPAADLSNHRAPRRS